MLTFLIVIGTLLYLIMAIIVYGTNFAYWQSTSYKVLAKRYYKTDIIISIIFGILWFITILDKQIRNDLIKSFKKNGLKFY